MGVQYGRWPIFDKVYVNGENTAPVYKFLKENGNQNKELEWNYEKFIVNAEGKVVGHFDSETSPTEPQFDNMIRDLLNA